MAANQPSSEKKTVAFKDKVIDSRITKKAKPKTISLADILSKPSDYTQPSVQQYPSNAPPPPVQEYPMDYPRPPVQQHPTNYPRPTPIEYHPSSYQIPSVQEIEDGEAHPPESEGLKLLEDIMEISREENNQEAMESDNVPMFTPQCRVQVRKREYERAPPIQMLQGQKQYDLEEVLRSIQPEISLAQLLDASATLRKQLYCLLRSIIPRTRRHTYKATDTVGIVHEQAARPPIITSRAKEDLGDAEAMYIDAWVGDTKITDILVDGGSMVDLIGTNVAQQLDLTLHKTADMGIRLADDTLIALDYYVWLDINVGGVVTPSALVTPQDMQLV